MRAALVILLTVLGLYYLGGVAQDFVKKGDFEKYLDAHPGKATPAIEYYFAMAFQLMNHEDASYRWFEKVRTQYPDSSFAADSWAEAIEILDRKGKNKEVEKESNEFLTKYPEHSKADLMRRKIFLLKNAY